MGGHELARYACPECGFAYDEARGFARDGFRAGTPWSAIPDDWACPDCAVREKPDFMSSEQVHIP